MPNKLTAFPDITDDVSGVDVAFTDNSAAGTPKPIDTPLENANPGKIEFGDSGSSLDKLMGEATGDTPADDEPPVTKEKSVEKLTEEKTEKPVVPPVKPAVKAIPPPDKEKVAADEPKDKIEAAQLPPHAKPATVTAFNHVKELARIEIAEKQKILETKEAEIEELKKKIPEAGKLPAEVEAELKELRGFRTAHDISADPAFKKDYVEAVTRNNDSILKKLTGAGFTDAHVAKIKEIGIDKLDWKPVLDALDPTARRSVEALLLSNEQINDKRLAALEEAKKNPEKYTAERTKVETERKAADDRAVRETIETSIGKVDWFKEAAIPAGATAEEKAAIEERNKFSTEQQGRMKAMLESRSPKMIGEMIASTLLAYQFMGELKFYKAKYEADHAELERVRKSSSTRRAERAAPAPRDQAPPPVSLLKPGHQALDDLRTLAQNED